MISVVVITYNRSKLLLETLKFILNQSIENIEIIIIDDGSEDETLITVNKIEDERIKYFNYGKIGNLSKLRNLGIKLAGYNFIAFCDDDDLWIDKNKLKHQMEYIGEYKLVCSNANIIDINNNVIKSKYFADVKESFEISKEYLLKNGNSVLTPSILFDKRILKTPEYYFDEVTYNRYCEDFDFLLRLSSFIKIYFIDEIMISVRFHDSISGGLGNNIVMLNSSIDILKNYSGNPDRHTKNCAIEGILGYKILLVRLSFKVNVLSGLTEFLKLFIYLFNPFVFFVFIKSKVTKKILKLLKIKIVN